MSIQKDLCLKQAAGEIHNKLLTNLAVLQTQLGVHMPSQDSRTAKHLLHLSTTSYIVKISFK